MGHVITLLPGDGIGPEVVGAAVQAIEATGVDITWEEHIVGTAALEEFGSPLPESVLESIKKNKIALKGPVTTPVGKGFKSVNVQIRQALDLYANVRPCNKLPGIKSPFENVNLVIFRENTEGLYSGLEYFDKKRGIADAIARVSEAGSSRIIKFAFEYAKKHGIKLTLVHKANILKMTSGLFLNIGRDMAKEYPDVEFNDRIVDNMCMQLVSYPERYDGLVTTNLFGDILSDLSAALVGGLGLVAGANIGDELAVFEAVHGSAPDIAGQDKANPTALMLTAEMMLHHIGEGDAAKKLRSAIEEVYTEGTHLTGDAGGSTSCSAFAAEVVSKIQSN